MPQKKNPLAPQTPDVPMDLNGFVSPALQALRNKPNKSEQDWQQLRQIEERRSQTFNRRTEVVDTPQHLQSNGRRIPAARLNNPGNLEPRDWQVGMRRVPGERFGGYETGEMGFSNLINSMRRYQTQGATIESFYHSYAPAFENNTEELIEGLTKRFNLPRNAPLRYINPRDLAEYIARRESSTVIRKREYGGDR